MNTELHTLKNGLKVALTPMKDTKTATVMVMTGVGSRYESKKENGISHFLEHMLFKGTKKRPNAKVIADDFENIGAKYNAFTSDTRTAYYASVSHEYTMTALELLSDIFLNSTLPAKEVNKERGAILQEISMYEDRPASIAYEVLDEAVFGASPLGRRVIGPKENVKRFTRKELLDYRNKNYTTANTVVSVAGNFPKTKVLSYLKKTFGSLEQGTAPDFEKFGVEQKNPNVNIRNKKTDQTHLRIGFPMPGLDSKDRHAFVLLSDILGGGMSSRLFTEVREKRGLAYSVNSFTDIRQEVGVFGISAGVAHDKLEETIKIIMSEIKKIKKSGVDKKELDKVKVGQQTSIAFSAESSASVAGVSASQLTLQHELTKVEEELEKLKKVKASDIKRVANQIFETGHINVAVVGPHKGKDLGKLLNV